MQRILLKSKIHLATVTDASSDHEGSISIDKKLMSLANIAEYEQVHVWDITNGNCLTTYAINGDPGEICMNGAIAKLINVGDIIVIAAFGIYETCYYGPRIIYVEENNNEKVNIKPC